MRPTRVQVVGNFCSSVVEYWSSYPEDDGLIPSWKALIGVPKT